MKEDLKLAIIPVGLMCLVHLAFVYGQAEWNIGKRDDSARELSGVFSFMMFVIGAIISAMIKINNIK